MRFALEALQANDGDCLLLHYERSGAAPQRVLIDGGSRSIYQTILKPRLDQLRGGAVLDLRMVVVSHIDADHITGIVDLFKALAEMRDNGSDAFCRIQTLWHNSFTDVHAGVATGSGAAVMKASLEGQIVPGLDPFTQAVVASVPQGNELRRYAAQLAVPVNLGAGSALVQAPETGQLTTAVATGLSFTVLAPHKAQLDRLQAAWQSSGAAHPADPAAQTADYLNSTVPNMSSIVLLAEAEVATGVRKRMLLTGDARGDVILDALAAAGLNTSTGAHFDLLKVQHHASNHSTTQDFFERVTADQYVISGNGKAGNPHPDALRWLSQARQGQPFTAYLTNRDGVEDYGAHLAAFLSDEAQHEPAHVYRIRENPALSIVVELAT